MYVTRLCNINIVPPPQCKRESQNRNVNVKQKFGSDMGVSELECASLEALANHRVGSCLS